MPFSWFRRRRSAIGVPRLRPRRERAAARRIDLSDIAPDALAFLGQAAYLKLEDFQTLSGLAASAPEMADKEVLGDAAGRVLAAHQRLVAELRRRGAEPAAAMQPFRDAIEGFHARTASSDWREGLLGVHIMSGLLDDFFVSLAAGLRGDDARIAGLLGGDPGADEPLLGILRRCLDGDTALAARLALWGRRLVGDTLLVARSALRLSGDAERDGERTEPVFGEILAAHTRRMDALGLAA